MNKTNIIVVSFFISINLIANLFFFITNTSYGYKSIFIWFLNFIMIYFIKYIIPPYSKINWFILTSYIAFNYYALNISTFNFYIENKYNFNHIINELNLTINDNVLKLKQFIPNFDFFAINVNFFSIILLFITLLYVFIRYNKFLNQIIIENIFSFIIISLFITVIFPIKNLNLYTENIGIGDLAQLNDYMLFIINYPLFSTVSIQIGIFLLITLFVSSVNYFISLAYFLIFLILVIGHISLNYSGAVEIFISCILSFSLYFLSMKVRISKYSGLIKFSG